MLLSKRALFIGLLSLGACGFEPVYAPGGTAEGLRGSILVAAPATRNDFAMLEHLEQRLGRATAAKYGLEVTTDITEEGLAISGSNDITRFNVLGSAEFTLRDLATGDAVLNDHVNTFTAYSASAQPASTRTAKLDAQTRLMVALADQIVARLLIRSDEF